MVLGGMEATKDTPDRSFLGVLVYPTHVVCTCCALTYDFCEYHTDEENANSGNMTIHTTGGKSRELLQTLLRDNISDFIPTTMCEIFPPDLEHPTIVTGRRHRLHSTVARVENRPLPAHAARPIRTYALTQHKFSKAQRSSVCDSCDSCDACGVC